MKKNTKKKVLALALIIALLAIAVVGGSLAWYTTEDTATNVITMGSIEVRQLETGKDGQSFENGQVLLPVLSETNVEQDPNFRYKRITVENTAGNAAYVRVWVAIPTQLEGYLCLKRPADNGWIPQQPALTGMVDGISYTAYCFVYPTPLETDAVTPEVLTGVYLHPSVDLRENAVGNLEFCKSDNGAYTFSGFEVASSNGTLLNAIEVLAVTQAVQAAHFEDAQSALNTAFGAPDLNTAFPFGNQSNP